ncbi:transcriptional regulator with XRE-family HTH domain [Streptomyces turgidiscabies]|uniref:Transcriptional regulator with XRE-family HTH domain n=1 Tax=Streptomyces turgidiscabies TaxID=85558 RepID=A0ABU0RJD7_9ACTN|nr:transcriptional regulator with XRE-family HTH domain [Streptomyces turgidiscabies]
MPRWRALPDELDPQVREFASQLRRLVDRSGLNIAAVADRTGYSKTSWERYLNGRLLAPKGAIVALAEVTNTNPVHLTTMWELAERAWSRSEMRHDMTMEAIRISQARAALGEFGGPAVEAKNGERQRWPGRPERDGDSGNRGPRGRLTDRASAADAPGDPGRGRRCGGRRGAGRCLRWLGEFREFGEFRLGREQLVGHGRIPGPGGERWRRGAPGRASGTGRTVRSVGPARISGRGALDGRYAGHAGYACGDARRCAAGRPAGRQWQQGRWWRFAAQAAADDVPRGCRGGVRGGRGGRDLHQPG